MKDKFSAEVVQFIESRIGKINMFEGVHFGHDGNQNLLADIRKDTFIKIIDFDFCHVELRGAVVRCSASCNRSRRSDPALFSSLARVVNIEHYHLNYDSDDVLNISRQLISKGMK